MAFRLRISAPALNDLDELLRHVKPELWDWADRMATEALEEILKLKRFPRLGAPSQQIQDMRDVRYFVSGPFRIYYQVNDMTGIIDILRFWPTRRRLPLRKDLRP